MTPDQQARIRQRGNGVGRHEQEPEGAVGLPLRLLRILARSRIGQDMTDDTLKSWYMCVTTTRQIAPFYGAEKMRGDFAVEAQLRDMGLQAHAPRKIEFKRKGKNRFAEAITGAYLPGYVFARIPPPKFTEALGARGIGSTLMAVSWREVRDNVLPFIDRASAEEAEAMRIAERGSHAEMCGFKAGEAIRAIAGPFADRVLEFGRMVRNAEGWPEIETEVELLGKVVKVRLDPLDVRRAG
ncbi:hypothetical protein Q4543_17665 [Salipiger sp. 1_MG-2023]|uniref:transcription termination/antitermination protein NusG n=1 Tax=Salipiger sp. 1_MG-2023 TaxID=3062665 RepID=UPI0026E2FBA7|nr:hypothetical protein [Salipiger sp. 1_MG-2023]MDO6587343.1 hypothetical protein [Salipiger sp. 1_MG-2023]